MIKIGNKRIIASKLEGHHNLKLHRNIAKSKGYSQFIPPAQGHIKLSKKI